METARAWGVSWRRWHGWEPARLTTYTYDDAGLLVAAVETVEPEWDHESRAHALALTDYEAGLCPGGNHLLSETTDPLMEGRYVPDGAIECWYCIAVAQSAASKNLKDHKHPHALLHEIKTLPRRKHRLGEAPT